VKEIKRYDINVYDEIFEQIKDGDWVKYTDHKAVVETMQKRIEELEETTENLWDILQEKRGR